MPCRSRTRSNSHSTSRSTSDDVGSSRNRISGSFSAARTISTICRCASEMSSTSSPGSICASPSRAKIASASRANPAALDEAQRAARLASDEQVLRDRHRGEQGQLLEDRPSAQRVRVLRAPEFDRPALDTNGALVGPKPAAEDLDQRRLAGAVLADERVHLPRAGGEGGGVERQDASERLDEIEPLHRRSGARPRLLITPPAVLTVRVPPQPLAVERRIDAEL